MKTHWVIRGCHGAARSQVANLIASPQLPRRWRMEWLSVQVCVRTPFLACHRGRFFRSLLTNLPNPVSEVFHSGGVWRRGDERECCVNTFQWLKRGCQAGGLSYSLKVAVGEEDGKTESGVTWKKKRLKIRVCNTRRRANTQTSAAFMWIPVPLRWQPFSIHP